MVDVGYHTVVQICRHTEEGVVIGINKKVLILFMDCEKHLYKCQAANATGHCEHVSGKAGVGVM